jgi:metal-responsive CopG/Arc/MetJ family transcriptional regulator
MASLKILQRSTKRASVSLPESVFEELQAIADEQGRSLSNLVAFLVESSLARKETKPGGR